MMLPSLLGLGSVLLLGTPVDPPAPPPQAKRLGIHLLSPGRRHLPLLRQMIVEALAPRGIDTLILEINYGFAYTSHPELTSGDALTAEDARELADLCREHGIRPVPMINCLGHQSWAQHTAALLTVYPEFDESPDIAADNEGIYCRSWCPQHPGVNPVVFALMDELIAAFGADAFHVGLDEVFIIAHDGCQRCRGEDPAELFAKAVLDYHGHLVGRHGLEMMMWGDRLLDAEATGYGRWEAADNGTAPAIDRIPRDIVICDWHYELRDDYPSVAYFQEQGFRVWPAGWRRPEATAALIRESLAHDGPLMLGHLFTVWGSGAELARVLLGLPEGGDASDDIRGVAQAIELGTRLLRQDR